MPPIPKGGVVAVTGSAGFIGSWIVKLLLDKGYRVKACVRNADDGRKTDFLKAMPGYATKRLTLHSCDIDVEGVFDSVFQGCHGVIHAAADLRGAPATYPEKYRKNQQYIIDSINKSKTVTRLIYTSSVAAVIHEVSVQEYVNRPVFYEGRYPDGSNPKRKNLKFNGYSVAKVQSEILVTKAAEESGRWDVIIANPADNVGPIQSKHHTETGWQSQIGSMVTGDTFYQQGAYRPWMVVDVRDDAEGHIRLLESVHVKSGERYILWSTDTPKVEEIARKVGELFPEAGFNPSLIPREVNSKSTQKKEAHYRSIWAGCDLRNDRIRATTGLTFRSFETTLRDCVESLITVGEIKPRLKAKI